MTERVAPNLVPLLADVEAHLSKRIRTIVTATVVAYSPTAQSATVQPAPRERDKSGEYEDLKPIQSAPVLFPTGGGGFSIGWPLAPGDPVLLLVADRSTEGWLVEGTTYSPTNGLRHSLTYSFVLPMSGPCPDPIPDLPSAALVIRGPAGLAITIASNGEIVIGTNQLAPLAARVADPINRSTAMGTWMGAVQTALSGLGAPITPFAGAIGQIASGSSTVRVS